MKFPRTLICVSVTLLIGAAIMLQSSCGTAKRSQAADSKEDYDPTAAAKTEIAKMKVKPGDWPQWMGWTHKNNTPEGKDIPTTWDVKKGTNIKWKAKLGSQTYGNVVVANGKVYVGTNNGAGYIKRYPAPDPKTGEGGVDLGCLICFDEKTGKFLWQHSSEKLAAGRVLDWPEQGICDAPFVEGNRLWFVTSRGEVICLDTEGFLDGENDGPFKKEPNTNKDEADVIWKFDMMGTLGSFQHNMCACSVLVVGDTVFVNTGNGVDKTHANLPSPDAASFFALNKNTGKLLWSDKSPGRNILHGQWSSPSYAVIKGRPMVFFGGGDGWLYAFDPNGDGKGNAKLHWKFDANPKTSKWILGARGTRNNIIATPVIYKEKVYVAVGQDPEHGTNIGHLWCIDPSKGKDGEDVSATLAVDKAGKPLEPRRLQNVDKTKGERELKNPRSAVVWHYTGNDLNGNNMLDFEETLHRSCGTVAIKHDILFIADFSGIVHCINALTGKSYWTYDMFTGSWGTPLIVDNKVYIGDEDGEVAIFPLTTDPKKALKKNANGDPTPALGEVYCDNAVYSTPVVANNVLYITNKNMLFAITKGGK